MDAMQKERRDKRLQTIKDCKTPAELASNIWDDRISSATTGLYRAATIDFIECWKAKTAPQWNKYKTPMDLANGIYKPYLDSPNDFGLFADLRAALVEWINEYAKT